MTKALVSAKVRLIKAVEAREAGQGSIEYVGAILIAAVLIGIVITSLNGINIAGKITEAINSVFDKNSAKVQ
jgi:hypothetical protein